MTASARDLHSQIDALGSGELRAAIAELVHADRAEALVLLDLLLAEESDLPRRMPVVERLVTLLSTSEGGGRREVVRDPASLTPRLAELSARIEAAGSRELGDHAGQLAQAAANRAEGPVLRHVLRVIQALKEELGTRLLATRVLQAAVSFNASKWSWLEEDLGGAPELEKEAGDGAETPREPPVATTPGKTEPAQPPQALATWQALGAPEPMAGDHDRDAAALPGTAEGGVAPTAGAHEWPSLTTHVRADAPARPERAAPRRRFPLRIVAVASAMAVAVALFIGLQERGTLLPYSTEEVRALSPVLASAYRDGIGKGAVFVGRVNESWRNLDPKRREKAAQELVGRLRRDGVKQALIYDSHLRLEARYVDGSLRTFETASR